MLRSQWLLQCLEKWRWVGSMHGEFFILTCRPAMIRRLYPQHWGWSVCCPFPHSIFFFAFSWCSLLSGFVWVGGLEQRVSTDFGCDLFGVFGISMRSGLRSLLVFPSPCMIELWVRSSRSGADSLEFSFCIFVATWMLSDRLHASIVPYLWSLFGSDPGLRWIGFGYADFLDVISWFFFICWLGFYFQFIIWVGVKNYEIKLLS